MNADIMPVAELPHRKEIKAAPTAPLARRRAGLSLAEARPAHARPHLQRAVGIKTVRTARAWVQGARPVFPRRRLPSSRLPRHQCRSRGLSGQDKAAGWAA